ncbi:hypothetical protein LTR86_001283 [Recurvomyces mirabilis]|nr:hypothetical protein LTR86_001283 [Recurvomyces mirabilis]
MDTACSEHLIHPGDECRAARFFSRLSTSQSNYIAYKKLYNGRWVATDSPAPAVWYTHTSTATRTKTTLSPRDKRQTATTLGIVKREFLTKSLADFLLFAGTLKAYRQVAYLLENYTEHRHRQETGRLGAVHGLLLLRLWTVAHYLITNHCALSLYHQALAFIAVGLGLNEPRDWPPFFGDFTAAFSVRRFWSRSWNQIVYRTFRNHANVFVRHVFRLQAHTAAARVAEGFIVFLISGVLHAVVSYQVGYRGVAMAEIVWFMSQPVAMLVEDLVQTLMSAIIAGVKLKPSSTQWMYSAGYLWVLGFFMFALPLRFWARWET